MAEGVANDLRSCLTNLSPLGLKVERTTQLLHLDDFGAKVIVDSLGDVPNTPYLFEG